MPQLHLATFGQFHAQRKCTSKSQRKEVEHLRSFSAFAVANKWMSENYAKVIKPPKDEDPETLPFEWEEVARLITACDRVGLVKKPGRGGDRRSADELALERLYSKALLLLLLYSGLRISDAVQMRRDRLDPATRKLKLRMMKTRHWLYLTLHPSAVEALLALPKNGPYFFAWYDGRTDYEYIDNCCGYARDMINRLARIAGVTNAHPHRFRDTFAKELLMQGKSIRTVQLLLGHTSVKTTEKHYAAFVPEYQEMLDDATASLDFAAA